MTRIPPDPEGYSVNAGTVHTRYSDHSKGYRVRTARGVESVLNGASAKVCRTCYPIAMREKPKSTTQRRRLPAVDTNGGIHGDSERP